MARAIHPDLITNDHDPEAVPEDTDEWRMRNRWRQKHIHAQIYYEGQREKILARWSELSGTEGLRPRTWHLLVNDKDIWDHAFMMSKMMSPMSQNDWALSETVEEGNRTVLEMEEYSFLNIMNATTSFDSAMKQIAERFFTQEYACQQFLKTVFVYAFAEISGKKFLVQYQSHPSLEVDATTIYRKLIIAH